MSGSCSSNIYLDMGYRSNPHRTNKSNIKSFDDNLQTELKEGQTLNSIQKERDENQNTIFRHFIDRKDIL